MSKGTLKLVLKRNDARSSDTDPRFVIDHTAGDAKVWGEPHKRRRGRGVYANVYLEIPTEYGTMRFRPEQNHFHPDIPDNVDGCVIEIPTPKVTFTAGKGSAAAPAAHSGVDAEALERIVLSGGDIDAAAAFYAETLPGFATASGNPTAACKRFAEGKLKAFNAESEAA